MLSVLFNRDLDDDEGDDGGIVVIVVVVVVGGGGGGAVMVSMMFNSALMTTIVMIVYGKLFASFTAAQNGDDYDSDDDNGDDDNGDDDLYIIGRFCLSVTKNDHFAQQSQIKFFSGSNLFFKHCNKKIFSMNCTCQQIFVFELLIF